MPFLISSVKEMSSQQTHGDMGAANPKCLKTVEERKKKEKKKEKRKKKKKEKKKEKKKKKKGKFHEKKAQEIFWTHFEVLD